MGHAGNTREPTHWMQWRPVYFEYLRSHRGILMLDPLAADIATATGGRSTKADPRDAEPQLAALTARVGRQDEAALGELYDATVAKLFGLARAILRNPADAEEVVCDTYTQVWQTAGLYDASRGTIMGWLVTICRSRALDLLRRRRVRERTAGAAVEGTVLPWAEPGPEDIIESVQQNTAVHRALATLPAVRRWAVALAFFRGLSHEEVAHVMGLPIGTVKSHIRRALGALEAELTKESDHVASGK
jgi:RNA polymerase sigma-70 factor (ECF subfamily)